MKIKLAALLFSILTVIGCAPSDPPTSVPDSSSNTNNDEASIKLKEDPPSCYSDETKELVKKLIKIKSEERFNQNIFFSNTICMRADEAGKSGEIIASGGFPFIISGENCVSKIDQFIAEAESKGNDQYANKLSQLKGNLLIAKDGEFSFEQYLVKSERRAPDQNSILCSFRLEPKISSASANSFYKRLILMNLRMYKQGENPERYYEYEFAWGDML